MSVLLDENVYKLVRKDDPSYQAMIRVSDANNIYDIKQQYMKNAERDDFAEPLRTWNNNRGYLNDGKYINMNDFFMESVPVVTNGVTRLEGKTTQYFRFKTNAILDYRNGYRIAGTYIDKTKYENVRTLFPVEVADKNGDIYTIFGQSAEKTLVENTYNSYPLQRVDKLVVYDLASLFLYINGRKIPDSDLFVYTNKSFTDVFIPRSYLGDIQDIDFHTDLSFYIDYRQAGSEELYWRKEKFFGLVININIDDPNYDYTKKDLLKTDRLCDMVVIYVDGLFTKPASVSLDGGDLEITLNKLVEDKNVEVYVLPNIVYRSEPEKMHVNKKTNKLHFFLPDNYIYDILSGPLTKSAVTFFYDGKKVDDDLITQTSRFSFEYDMSVTPDFDPDKVEFFVEDINWRIDDKDYATYGDDYYLLNLLGVRRCVDKMRGFLSYSIFDDPAYRSLGFKKTLSDNGELFDVLKAVKKYTDIDRNINSPTTRTKELISERPTLLRKLLEQWKIPVKRMVVLGNAKDVTMSSVIPIDDPDQQVYYKIYVNHKLISSLSYTTDRQLDHDIITISKDVLQPINTNPEHPDFNNGINEIELYQYDMTYKDKAVMKENVNTWTKSYETDGYPSYTKTFRISDLPFGEAFTNNDLCAIERVIKGWFDSTQPEYSLLYPSSEGIGYRMVKIFEIVNRTTDEITMKVALHDYVTEHNNGTFFIMCKTYNVIEEFVISNEDNSYMADNDVVKPIYSTYTEYDTDINGRKIVKEFHNYIPYINNSEPIISKNGSEQIYGANYTFINPQTSDGAACSYLMLKTQPNVDDVFTVMFNSSKTNILVVGYDNLNLDNRYGLVYLSELKYPISPEYMNINVNGEKLSAMDMDILSDKLVRFHHIYRPITSILITTNSHFKDTEIQDYLDLYEPSEFERTLEDIFHNCDPSKAPDANKPIVDYVYKVDPYYSEFVGEEEHEYDNPHYKEYSDWIIEHRDEFDRNSIWSALQPEPNEEDEPEKHEAWVNAEKFFSIYKWNHGFIDIVDSVHRRENPKHGETPDFKTDVALVLYLNWLANSRKTRTYGWKAEDIDPIVLRYFSLYQNMIVEGRIDFFINAGTVYDGLQDVQNEIIRYDFEDPELKPFYQYPGGQIDLRRRSFWEIFLEVFSEKNGDGENGTFAAYPSSDEENILEAMNNHRLSNVLYPQDFPFEPDSNGIRWTGSDLDIIVNGPRNQQIEGENDGD